MDKTANHQAPCCQHCGNELVGETTGGLCPRCLLAMNMASRTMPDGETVPQPPPPTAEEIAGHFPQFEILEYLGRGGMGIVYKARQKVLDRLVAIKVLAGERRDDPQFEVRFSREARTLAKLNHPNIVTVHDFGESGGMFYLVMEYVDGVNLRDVLRDGQMEPAQALVIVPAICEALQYAHEHDVVHRDIKPENILLDREGRVKIADFGIATLVGATAERSGTPPYMAPEQEAADGKVDHRADIYALGVVFYEMLTGERPAKDLIAPSKKVQLDVRIDEIVLHALEQEPERRYQTAGEFGTVVGTMASHPPTPYVVPAAVPAPSQPVTPSHGRWQPIVAALLLIGSMLAWGILGYLNYVLPRLAEQFAARDIELPTATRWIFQLGGFLSHFGILLVPLLMLVTGGALVWLFLSVTSPRADSVLTLEQQKARVWPVRKAWGLGVASLCFVFGALINGEQALRVSISGAEGSHAWLVFVNLAAAVGFGVASFRYARASRGRPSTQRAGVALPVLAGITILGLVLTALLFWVQRPRPWDGSALSGESYDQMFVAGGRTWYAKRIFGDDCTFYRFEVHGRGGSVVERWDVKVPFKKLATNSARPPRHKISFANNGGVFWSEDSKRVSFRVNGVEVAGFDTDTGKPTRPEGEGETPEEVLRDYTEAGFNGDIRQALSMIGPPLSETREEVANALLRLRVREEDKAQPLELAEWHKEGDYALARYENPPEMRAHQMPHKPYVILERSGTTWKVVWAAVSRIENSPADNLRAFRRFQRVNCEDRKEVARAFIGAIARGDTATAFMFCAQPMGGSPSEFFRKFSKATQGSGPLKWHEDGPYAVTHAAFLADQPEVETAVILKQAGEIWRVVWANGSSPTATLADDLKRFKQEKMVSRVMVEDLALQFLVAIREQDEKALRELCVDRTEGWTAALVGQFAMELREMFHKKTGAEFTMYPDSIRVEKDLAVVTCRAFREVQKFLGGNILVLYFCRTGEGWKVWTARKAPASQSLDEHLEQARKWAAEWDHPETGNAVETTPATPEHVARAFMQAIQFGNIDAAMHWAAPEMKARKNPRRNFEGLAAELKKAYAGKLALLTEFTEWYPQNRDEDTRFVGTRIAGVPADDGTERLHSLYLILSPTADGWKVAHLDDAYSDKPLSHYVDRIERIIPGEGPLIRDEAAERPADSAVGVPGTGGAIEVGQGESVVRSVNLPDADTADVPKVLDLASGELLGVPVEGQRDIIKHFNKLGKGDLAWDNGLSTFRGAKVHEWHNGVWELVVPDRESEGCASYRLLKLPKRLLVTTAEGD
ncbi:MAG: protein kinase, partial [Akkermansiaceae bacterium]|nr:protein kinase [Akkermansiaceae bacterium]